MGGKALALLGVAVAGVAAACGSVGPQPTAPWCTGEGLDCDCFVAVKRDPSFGPSPPCNPDAYPGTTCCADTDYPKSGICACYTNAIACGIVPGYFEPIFDGGPTAGCVCTAGGPNGAQALGASCEPGGWSDPPSTVGVCCFYPADFPGQLGMPACACGPSFNCAPGTTRVASCSAASFPASAPVVCDTGRTQVPSCVVGGDAGPPSDAGPVADALAESDAPATEAGVCGSGAPSSCNQITNRGTALGLLCVVGAPPAMTGGAIADGTYVLTSGTAYVASCAGLSLPTGGPTTLVVAAGCMQSMDVTGGAKTYTYATSGSTLTENEICPGSGTVALPFSATATSLSELGPLTPGVQVLSVFQKQ